MNKETIIKISDLAKIDIKDDQIDDILTSLEKQTAVVTINRPKQLNALNKTTIEWKSQKVEIPLVSLHVL